MFEPMHTAGSIAQQRYGTQQHSYGTPGVQEYSGPHGAGTSYQKGYRSSFETHGGSFTSSQVAGGHVTGLSAQNRSGLVNWDAGSTPAGFQQN